MGVGPDELQRALDGAVDLETLLGWAASQGLPLTLDTAKGACRVHAQRRFEVVVDGTVFAYCEQAESLVGAPDGALIVEHGTDEPHLAEATPWGPAPRTAEDEAVLRCCHLDVAARHVRIAVAMCVGGDLEEVALDELLPIAEALTTTGRQKA